MAFQEINFFTTLWDLLDLSIAPESRTLFFPTKSIPPHSYRVYMADHDLEAIASEDLDDTSTS